MIKRKHRVCVEITLENPDTNKRAVQLVALALELTRSTNWDFEVTKFKCKSFNACVVRAL